MRSDWTDEIAQRLLKPFPIDEIKWKDRFWAKVAVAGPDECWEWLCQRDRDGYGRFDIKRKHFRATRIAYELTVGPMPTNLLACHTCDNNGCVNPSHLFPGTHKDNIRDCISKGRRASFKGSLHGNARLDEADVLAIRQLYSEGWGLQREIAKWFGVRQSLVSMIVNRKIWDHV